MGFKRMDVTASLAAAIRTIQMLAGRVRERFEAFVPEPELLTLAPPTEAFRNMLDLTDAHLAVLASAGDKTTLIDYPVALESTCAHPAHWLGMTLTSGRWRVIERTYRDVVTLAYASLKLSKADERIRVFNDWAGKQQLDEAWADIRSLSVHDGGCPFHVVGGINVSEGIRGRVENAFAPVGLTGGWSAQIRRASWCLAANHSDEERPLPPELTSDLVFDEWSGRYVLHDELGHDMLPALDD